MRRSRAATGFELLEDRRLLAFDPLGTEFQLNTTTGGNQENVAIGADGAGNFVTVWQGPNVYGHGTNEIYLQRFSAVGTPLGSEQQVNADWHGEQTDPAVAVASDGSFIVTRTAADAEAAGVYLRRFDATGVPATGDILVNTYTAGDQYGSAVAVSPTTGKFVVVWQSNGQDGSSWGIYGQQFGATGAKQGGEFSINTSTSGDQSNPAVAMDNAGDFVVAWRSDNDGSC